MDIYYFSFLFIFSAAVSAFGSIIGFGGGVFMIPVLVIIFKIPINIAVGSVIFALFPSAVVSSAFNMKSGRIDYWTAIILEIPTVFGTIAGAYFTKILPVKTIEILFAAIIFTVGITGLKNAGKVKKRRKDTLLYKLNSIGPGIIRRSEFGAYKVSYLMSTLFGLVSGMIAGFLGIGGGFLKTPIMVNVFNLHPLIASATALFMIVFTSFTGTVSHYLFGHIYFEYALPVVSGFITGAVAANMWGVKLSGTTLKYMVAAGLILASVSVFVYAIGI